MIPRHRPPFGIVRLLNRKLRSLRSGDIAQLESQCSATHGVPHAVWLPSARYGICKTIEAVLNDDAVVYGPVFTCKVVHEAVHRSGRHLRLLDCAAGSCLMNVNFADRSLRRYGVVLSEVFGHRYRATPDSPLIRNAGLRIFDMAMAIPDRDDLQRLRNQDVAVISFGLGKSLYSGWGGMAFTKDKSVADVLRQSRDRDLVRHGWLQTIAQEIEVVLRTVAHQASAYGLLRTLSEKRPRPTKHIDSTDVALVSDATSLSREWWHRPSPLSTMLTADNFRQAAAFDRQRWSLAGRYRQQLAPLDGTVLRLPPDETHGLSHFSIRISAGDRDALRQYLWTQGVDTATLFPFPSHCRREDFPRSVRLCSEIINLPLSHQLTSTQVNQICEAINSFRFSATTPRAAA